MTMEPIFKIDKTTETPITHITYPSWKSQDQINNNPSLGLRPVQEKLPFHTHHASYSMVLSYGISGKKNYWILKFQNKKYEITGRNNNVTKLFCRPENDLLRHSHRAVCCT